MRKLTLIGICLLIVTSVAWAGQRDNGSRDSGRSSYKPSSSSDSRSSSSNDRGSSATSASSYRPSSTPNVSYRPNNAPTSTPSVTYRSNSGSGYNPGKSGSNQSSSSYRSTPVTQPRVTSNTSEAYAPTTRYTRDAKLAEARQSAKTYQQPAAVSQPTNRSYGSSSESGRDVYSAYRPAKTTTAATQPARAAYLDRDNRTVNGSASYTPSDHTSYRDRSNSTVNGSVSYTPSSANKDKGRSDYYLGGNSYRPDNKSDKDVRDYKPADTRKSGTTAYKPAEPTTRSVRDAKLADARQSSRTGSATAYRPNTTFKQDYRTARERHSYDSRVWSNYRPTRYVAPKSYLPPRHHDGHYYYQTHWTRPCYFGYWSWDYYPGFSHRSVYFYYDLFPFIQITRIIVRDYPRVVYIDQPIYTGYDNYYDFDRYPGLDDALADLRSAWVSGRFDLIAQHVRDSNDIAVMLDGRYDYSVRSDDYLSMTRDAIAGMDTISFVWDKVQRRSNGQVTAFAEHTYRSSDYVRTVYVSYTLQRIGGGYYITEVGTTESPWN